MAVSPDAAAFIVWQPVQALTSAFVLMMAVALGVWLACLAYHWALVAAAFSLRHRVSAANGGIRAEAATFTIVVPAHDEAETIGDAVRCLGRLNYPESRRTVIVVADNCTDGTATEAQAAGATVLTRVDAQRRGKGHALAWAMPQVISAACVGTPPDAVVIIDADTVADPDLLAAFDSELERGRSVIQASYSVLNPGASWRTRLMDCALGLAHIVKPLGRERMGLSTGLKGNGMCFRREVLEQVPWSGESIVEDLEYTARLCRAGYRIAFAPEARVWAQMPAERRQAAVQRMRWEGGRHELARKTAAKLLWDGLRTRNVQLIDRAADLLLPPLAEMAAVPLVALALCLAVYQAAHVPSAALLAQGWLLLLCGLLSYVLAGLWIAGAPVKSIVALGFAPIYMVWKLGLSAAMAASGAPSSWHRTHHHKLNS